MEDPSRARVTGPLEPYAAGFAAELARLGYTSGSAYGQMFLMAHVSRWLAGEGLDAGGLTPEAAERFLAARRAAGYTQLLSPKALAPLLGYLRRAGRGAGGARAVPAGPAGELLDRFRRYLVTERGIGAATAADYAAKTRPFLASRLTAGGPGLAGLTAADVTAFVVANCPSMRKGTAKLTVTALRSLLGWLHVAGEIPGPLAWAVPAVATWRLASLPAPLEPGQVAAMLGQLRHGHGRRAAGPGDADPAGPARAAGRRGRRRCPWTTSTGGPGRSPSPARAGAASGCPCRPTSARRSPPTCATAGPSRSRAPGGCSCGVTAPHRRPDHGRGHPGGVRRRAAGGPGPGLRAPAASHGRHRDAAGRGVPARGRPGAAAPAAAVHGDLRQDRRPRAARAGAPLAGRRGMSGLLSQEIADYLAVRRCPRLPDGPAGEAASPVRRLPGAGRGRHGDHRARAGLGGAARRLPVLARLPARRRPRVRHLAAHHRPGRRDPAGRADPGPRAARDPLPLYRRARSPR